MKKKKECIIFFVYLTILQCNFSQTPFSRITEGNYPPKVWNGTTIFHVWPTLSLSLSPSPGAVDGHVKRRFVKAPAESIYRFVERKKGGQGLQGRKKLSTPVPEEANLVIGYERRIGMGFLEWFMGVGCGRKGGGREREGGKERESNAKRVHRSETGWKVYRFDVQKHSSSHAFSRWWAARALGPMGFNPQRDSSGAEESVEWATATSNRPWVPRYIQRLLFCLACYLSTLVSNVFRKRCSPSSGIFELCPLRVFVSSLFRIRSFCLISFDNIQSGGRDGGILDPSCLCFSCQAPGNVKYSWMFPYTNIYNNILLWKVFIIEYYWRFQEKIILKNVIFS